MSFLQLLKMGGWVMWPLVVGSIVVWGVCIERAIAFRKYRQKNREFLLSFSNSWLKSDFESAKKLCQNTSAELAPMALEIVEGRERKIDSHRILARVQRKRLEVSAELRRFLWILGTIGSAAPFVGLLGTVIGIMQAFHSIAETGSGGFSVVASGISEALVATAAGIVVAVIAVFSYNFFQTLVGSLQFQLKLLTEELLELTIADSIEGRR